MGCRDPFAARCRGRVFSVWRALLLSLAWVLVGVASSHDALAAGPAYLRDMPTVAFVTAKTQGGSPLDTAARLSGALRQLVFTVRALSQGGEFGDTMTPEERVLSKVYSDAESQASTRGHAILTAAGATGAAGPDSAAAKWMHATIDYGSEKFRREVLAEVAPAVLPLDVAKKDGPGVLPSIQLPPSLQMAPSITQSLGPLGDPSNLRRNATMLVGLAFLTVLLFYLVRTRNGLYKAQQTIKQHKANLTHIVEMKSTMVNELYELVRGQVKVEQLTNFKISQDTTGGGIVGAYQQAGAMLSAVQTYAQRFPQLQHSPAFANVSRNIQECEHQLLAGRQFVNRLIGEYNKFRGAFPKNVFAGLLQYPEEEFVNFDVSQARGPARAISFASDDRRRIDHVMGMPPAAAPAQFAPPAAAPQLAVQPALPQLGMHTHSESMAPGARASFAPSMTGARGGGTQAVQAIPMMVPSASIRFLAGPLGGRSVPVGSSGAVVGREPAAAQIVVPDPQVSSAHAWIGMRGTSLTFVDQGSTNGSVVNGAPVRAGDEIPLKHGDVVSLGRTNSVQFVVETR